jgi:hypothetical protein
LQHDLYNSYKIFYCLFKNKSNILNGIFENLLESIIYGNLTRDKLKKFINCYVRKTNNKSSRSFKRISKIPFSKWYVKTYLDLYIYMQIISAIEKNNKKTLEKTLKSLSKNIKILET